MTSGPDGPKKGVRELSRMTDMSPPKLMRLALGGKIRVYQDPTSGRLLYNVADAMSLVNKQPELLNAQ